MDISAYDDLPAPFTANFTSKDQTAPIPRHAKLLVGTKTLPPAGVAVWTE